MELPLDLYPQILSNLSLSEKEKEMPSEERYPNKIALGEAENHLNAMLVCKEWNSIILESKNAVKWSTLHKEINRNHRVAKKRTLSEKFYRTLVYCACEQERLDKEIHDYVAENRLVYRSKRIQRVFKTSELGIRKLKQLGKEKLKGKKKQYFIGITKRYDRIHRTYLDMCNITKERDRYGFLL